MNEIERRKVGQDVQKLKRWQDDQTLKNVLEEREREKQQEKAARDRVLAQIAQDKADRAARFSNTPPQVQNTPPPPIQRPAPVRSNTARLQFKLPDGTSHTHDFESSEPLEVVRTYISTNLNLAFNSYVLSTAFPRREFTDNNNAESLADLGLAPNAVVLVLPVNQGAISTRSTSFMRGLFWSIVAPFFSIFEYVRSFVFGGGPRQHGSTTGSSVRRPSPDAAEASTSRLVHLKFKNVVLLKCYLEHHRREEWARQQSSSVKGTSTVCPIKLIVMTRITPGMEIPRSKCKKIRHHFCYVHNKKTCSIFPIVFCYSFMHIVCYSTHCIALFRFFLMKNKYFRM